MSVQLLNSQLTIMRSVKDLVNNCLHALLIVALLVVSACNTPAIKNSNQSGDAAKINYKTPAKVTVPLASNILVRPCPLAYPIQPPFEKKADFFVNLKNFNTDNGLALDAVSCSAKDHFGNLWFGTDGGGVSKYDGNTFVNYTTEQGLATNEVNSIFEDSHQNTWIGTIGGLSCFNGQTIQNIYTSNGLTSNIIDCLFEDRLGRLWVGTMGGGINCFIPDEQDQKGAKAIHVFSKVQGLTNDTIWSIAEDSQGTIWIGTQAGLCYADTITTIEKIRFKSFSENKVLQQNRINAIVGDKMGRIWVGTTMGLISFAYDNKNNNRIEVKPASIRRYTEKEGLLDNTVKCLALDNEGQIYAGTPMGLSCLTNTNDENFFISNYTTSQGLPNNYIRSITVDLMSNLWLGFQGGGVARFEGKSFVNYTEQQGLGNSIVRSIAEDKEGNMWFGTESGATKLENGQFKTYRLNGAVVLVTYLDNAGNIWFGTNDQGVACLNLHKGKSFNTITNFSSKQGLVNDAVSGIAEDNLGNLWIGTLGGGLSCLSIYEDQKKYTIHNYSASQGLAQDIVLCVFKDHNGNIWVGTQGGGISFIDLHDGASQPTITTFSIEQGLSNNVVQCITEDNYQNIWVGTDGGGLSRIEAGNLNQPNIINYTSKDGLPDNVVSQVVFDAHNNICIGTNFGIAILSSFQLINENERKTIDIPAQNKLTNAELEKYTPEFEIFNSSKGYPIKDVNSGQSAMFKDDKGAIWMGTGSVKSGLVRFDPTRVKRSTTPPIVSIQNIKINNEFISWNDLYAPSNQMIAEHSPKTRRMLSGTAAAIEQQLHYGKLLNQKELITMREKYADCRFDAVSKFYPIPENLVLPNKHNNITFDFAAIETDRPFLVNYSYILDGYDKEWSPPSTKHTATFGNIYEGSHTFRVKAASPSGNWSEPITYTFKVLPPWYRLWWMYAIYLFGGLTAIGITVKWRERNLKREKALLEQKVELRTQQLDERNKLVEDKNKDILDSIYYAKRIQDALLNKETEFTNNTLPEHFILFLAKDIVSGDFFWTTQKDDYWYVAVVDCTGHGVPGAFMSMLGMSFLNSISSVPYLQSPAEILNELRDKVVRELGQKGKSENTKDGMDISLVRINLKTREIQWAGANNALNLVRNNVFEEIKADKQPIGFHHNPGPFTNHSLQLNQGDSIYIYSDGFADQFGGPLGKKFKYRQLEELLLRNSQLKSKEQQEVLEQAFISWKGTLEQVDDVCIIGIKL